MMQMSVTLISKASNHAYNRQIGKHCVSEMQLLAGKH